MKKAIEQRDEDVQKYNQEKQNETNDYNNQIEQLIQEKYIIEAQNRELADNLNQANDELKQYNQLITDKYSSLEEELNQKLNDNNLIKKNIKIF